MKKIYFLFITLFSMQIAAQKIIDKQLDSKELHTTRALKIFLPKGYDNDVIAKYPVAIVLGDEYLFDLYVGNAKLYANIDKAPKQIVIGINMDKTYLEDTSIIPVNNGLTNSANRFYNFIKKELLPFIDANYKSSPFITITAEGQGANFITHFLKDEKPIFNSFICIAPTFTNLSAKTIRSYSLGRLSSVDNSYFIFSSNNKKYIEAKQNDIFGQIGTYLSSFDAKNLEITFDTFKNAPSHLSVISETIPRAFTKMFSIYSKISGDEYEKNVKDLSPLEAIKYVEDKYINIEYLYGTNLNVRIEDIFAIESIVMDRQDGDYLRVLGDFVMIKYPESHMGDYYVGRYYELGEQYEKAEFYYKAAYGKMDLSNPNANAFYENIKRVVTLLKNKPKEEKEIFEDEEN